MTIRERLEELLVKHGLWPEEAKAVLQMCVEAPEIEAMQQYRKNDLTGENEVIQDRWGEEVAGYPPQLLAVLWMLAKQHAVEWIDANKPKHFARHVLTNKPQASHSGW